MKLPPRERLVYEERARLLWSFLVRSPKKCVRCHFEGPIESFDGDHIIKRSRSLALSVDLENGACLCVSCHREFRHATHPAGMKVAEEWLQERFANRLDRLEAKSRQVAHGFSWKTEYERLWSEVSRLNLHEAFREYIAHHQHAAEIWQGG